jgi:cell division protein FtsI/penicillin-binding protein 2
VKNDFANRYSLVTAFFIMMAILVIGQIIRFQFIPEAEEIDEAFKYSEFTLHTYYPARGNIYDRYGKLLAGSQRTYEVAIIRNEVKNAESIAFALSKVLANHEGYNNSGYFNDVFTVASSKSTEIPNYVVVADYVTEDELADLKKWAQEYAALPASKEKDYVPPTLDGLVYRPRLKRTYPEKTVASTVMGFVNWEGNGLYGIEQQYNDLLAGEALLYWVNINPYKATNLPRVSEGADLVLTIDRDLQASVEKILDAAISSTGAEGGSVLVMNPETGDILAMVSSPRVDLNQYWVDKEMWTGSRPFNPSISKTYEPGSVFKVLTMSAVIDSGLAEPDTIFNDTGSVTIGGITIHNWDYSAHGAVTMTECMQYSLNVCLASMAKELGAETFYKYMQRFGIGQLTGIDLAYEEPGILRLPGDGQWFESDLGTNAFGQGLAVTPVQMLMAVSAMANDGHMVYPHVMRAMVTNGAQTTPPYLAVGMPVSVETAHKMTDMLAVSLEEESSVALVPGYRVAGKTGTAEIPTASGYTSDVTNASFVGWGPVDDAKFLIYVWLEKPTSSIWGSVVAAPVFSQVFSEAVRLYDVPPDNVRMTLNGQ